MSWNPKDGSCEGSGDCFRRENGITNRALAEALGLGASAVTRRDEAERVRGAQSSDLVKLRKELRGSV